MRALYLPWDLAIRERDRLLDDLQAWTRIDTVMLLDLYFDTVNKGRHRVAYVDSRVAVPPGTKFGVPVSVMSEKQFATLVEFMTAAKSRGFKVAAIAAPLFICGGRESMACVDVSGRRLHVREKTLFYGCPNNEMVVDYGRTFIRSLIDSWPDLDYLSLDHLEYPSNLFVSYPKADLRDLLVCFCESCERKAAEEGFDIGRARQDVDSLLRAISSPRQGGRTAREPVGPADLLNFLVKLPHLTEWLNFRMKSMTDYAKKMAEVSRGAAAAKGSGLQVGFYFQLPSISNLVGTDYESLCQMFDYACAKFPDYIPGTILPMIADEIAKGTRAYDRATLLSSMRGLLDLGPGPKRYKSLGGLKDVLLYSNAADPSMVDMQMKRLSGVVSKTNLFPHFWEHNGDVKSLRVKMEAARKYHLKGYSVWAFDDGLSRENLRAASGVI